LDDRIPAVIALPYQVRVGLEVSLRLGKKAVFLEFQRPLNYVR
jgi:hypothetical protein